MKITKEPVMEIKKMVTEVGGKTGVLRMFSLRGCCRETYSMEPTKAKVTSESDFLTLCAMKMDLDEASSL